jgi:hypothetical protein
VRTRVSTFLSAIIHTEAASAEAFVIVFNRICFRQVFLVLENQDLDCQVSFNQLLLFLLQSRKFLLLQNSSGALFLALTMFLPFFQHSKFL